MSEIRKKEEKTEIKREVPEEIELFKECIIFDEERFSKLRVAKVDKLTVGKVDIDEDEKAALRLHPNFAILKCLKEEEQERDIELGLSKLRIESTSRAEKQKIGNVEYEVSEGKRIKLEAQPETREQEKEREIIDAKERHIYDPIH